MEQTKTLCAKLHKPNKRKKKLLNRSFKAYQQGLEEGIKKEIDTQTDANDMIIKYDLSGYMKNALKRHIPKVVDNGGKEVSENNAVKINK